MNIFTIIGFLKLIVLPDCVLISTLGRRFGYCFVLSRMGNGVSEWASQRNSAKILKV